MYRYTARDDRFNNMQSTQDDRARSARRAAVTYKGLPETDQDWDEITQTDWEGARTKVYDAIEKMRVKAEALQGQARAAELAMDEGDYDALVKTKVIDESMKKFLRGYMDFYQPSDLDDEAYGKRADLDKERW